MIFLKKLVNSQLTLISLAIMALSSCDKMDIEPKSASHQPSSQTSVKGTRSLQGAGVYYSTPSVGASVPKSTVNIRGKGTAIYHGGVLSATVLRQNGSEFTIRITKQDGGIFKGNGIALVTTGSVDGGIANRKAYSAGVSFVDLEVTATFDRGAVHFYPATVDRSSGYRYYAEPVLIYTSPMYAMKSSYTRYENLGVLNGVIVKAAASNLLERNILTVQCTEFCCRYYSQVYGIDIVNTGKNGGHASTWYENASAKGLIAYKNGGDVAPRPGDILCMLGGRNGHVAIIMEVANSYIKVAQQNAGIPGHEWMHAIGGYFSYNSSTKTIFAPKGYVVQGWLRLPAN